MQQQGLIDSHANVPSHAKVTDPFMLRWYTYSNKFSQSILLSAIILFSKTPVLCIV